MASAEEVAQLKARVEAVEANAQDLERKLGGADFKSHLLETNYGRIVCLLLFVCFISVSF